MTVAQTRMSPVRGGGDALSLIMVTRSARGSKTVPPIVYVPSRTCLPHPRFCGAIFLDTMPIKGADRSVISSTHCDRSLYKNNPQPFPHFSWMTRVNLQCGTNSMTSAGVEQREAQRLHAISRAMTMPTGGIGQVRQYGSKKARRPPCRRTHAPDAHVAVLHNGTPHRRSVSQANDRGERNGRAGCQCRRSGAEGVRMPGQDHRPAGQPPVRSHDGRTAETVWSCRHRMRCRKQLVVWSLTMPMACMNA